MGDGCIINRVHSLSEHRFCSPAGEGKANDIAKSPANQTQALQSIIAKSGTLHCCTREFVQVPTQVPHSGGAVLALALALASGLKLNGRFVVDGAAFATGALKKTNSSPTWTFRRFTKTGTTTSTCNSPIFT